MSEGRSSVRMKLSELASREHRAAAPRVVVVEEDREQPRRLRRWASVSSSKLERISRGGVVSVI